jgi:hypothetical protein
VAPAYSFRLPPAFIIGQNVSLEKLHVAKGDGTYLKLPATILSDQKRQQRRRNARSVNKRSQRMMLRLDGLDHPVVVLYADNRPDDQVGP